LHFLHYMFTTYDCSSVLRSRTMCKACARRAAALRSYRSSLISSDSAIWIASAVPSGCVVGMPEVPTRSASPRVRWPGDCDAAAVPVLPNNVMRDMTATLTRPTCARSNSACATVRAHSRVTVSVVAPAILRANRSIYLMRYAFVITPAARPWRKEFRLDLFLPARERGPVLRCALRRLAAIWRAVTIDQAAAGGGFLEASSSARTLPSMTRLTLAWSCCPNPPRNSASKRSALPGRDHQSIKPFEIFGCKSHGRSFDCILIELELFEYFQNTPFCRVRRWTIGRRADQTPFAAHRNICSVARSTAREAFLSWDGRLNLSD